MSQIHPNLSQETFHLFFYYFISDDNLVGNKV